jgi:hypothetical protein
MAAVQFVNSNPNATQNGHDVQQLFYLYSYNQARWVTMAVGVKRPASLDDAAETVQNRS